MCNLYFSFIVPRPLAGICSRSRHRSSPPTGDASLNDWRPRAGTLCGFERGEDIGRVALRLHLGPDMGYQAVGIDQESRALDAHELAPVVDLFDPCPVALRDGVVDIGQEHEVEAELALERGLAATAQHAHA